MCDTTLSLVEEAGNSAGMLVPVPEWASRDMCSTHSKCDDAMLLVESCCLVQNDLSLHCIEETGVAKTTAKEQAARR